MDLDFRAGGSPGISVVHGLSRPAPADPAEAVTALYQEHALVLTRMAHIMLGSRPAAEDVVHDAFCGLYRRWGHLDSKDKALAYVRSSVLNGCRSVLRSGKARVAGLIEIQPPNALSAEAIALLSEERREVVEALWQLPDRQREVLVLRYYLDLSDEQIGRDLGMARSSVRSARRRALAKLERSLRGTS
jgi:RNA polymerase sigma-70 factor (sigma-E family)